MSSHRDENGGVRVVPEAGGWSIFITDLPLAADGATFEAALSEMVDAFREYAEDWHDHLFDAPNHRDNSALVQLIERSGDEELRRWLLGAAADGRAPRFG
ncbi:hypothetical protein ACFO4E_04870 [Nocardiopsis mangrovi]|uniref:Uncharacterized protein n=1 Tax=Nocardiopsis mangrovi TaxID=1179818 RepID=A0ABV9DR99_9ACTN